MTLEDFQAQLGTGLLLGPGTPYTVETIDGLDRATRPQDTERANADGAVMGPDFRPPRTVFVKMTVRGSSPADCMSKYNALTDSWTTRTPEGGQGSTYLRYKLPGQAARRFEGGRPRGVVPKISTLALGWIRVVAEYFAPDPLMYADDLGTGPGGERVIDLVMNADNVTIPNTGNCPAPVWYDVYGAVTNPGVIRSEAKRFDLAAVIANGTYYRIRTAPKTVTLSTGGGTNRFQDISGSPDPYSPFLEIPAGGALFRAVGTAPGVNAKVRLTYRDCWDG